MPGSSRLASRILISAIAVVLLSPLVARALPSQPVVSAGSASFLSNETGLDVTTQDFRNIINWTEFSIGDSTATAFIQPGAGDSVLNRVIGNQPTVISGDITSNGGLVIINPAGIYLAPGASIHASFLTLSTLNLSDADFLAGLGNYGNNNGGSIEISGSILAPQGSVNILSGSSTSIMNGALIQAGSQLNLTAGGTLQIGGSTTTGFTTGGVILTSYAGQNFYQVPILLEGGTISMNAYNPSITLVTGPAPSGPGQILPSDPIAPIVLVDMPTISMVPEPGEYALILAGLALLAIRMKRPPGICRF